MVRSPGLVVGLALGLESQSQTLGGVLVSGLLAA